MTRYIHRRPRAQAVPITPAPTPAPPESINLNLRQQGVLAEVIEAAKREPGALRLLSKDNWIYSAQHRNGRTRWIIQDWDRKPIADGFC